VACIDVTGLPHGAQRFRPPAQFRAWWKLTELCSGLHGDFDTVRWYVLPNSDVFSLEGQTVNGAWYGDGNRIVVGDSEGGDGSLIRHEMLHALLRSGAHPRSQFLANCGDIVVCIEQCVSESGGPLDTSSTAMLAGPQTFVASTLVVPNPMSFSADSGWVTITATLTNSAPYPVRAAVQTYHGMPMSFVIFHMIPTVRGAFNASGVLYQFDQYMAFAPAGTAGATRRVVFDERVVPLAAESGTLTVTTSFARDSAPPVTLTVGP
jgi:hypothetical protein